MKLPTTFYKLPFHFDVDRLKAETEQFAAADWSPHPQGFAGNDALILVSVDGGRNDEFAGEMKPTPILDRCPYVRQVMARFDTVVGRSRLMRLAGGAEVTAHYDLHYNWYHRVRIHVPIVTDPSVRFLCGPDEIYMKPGEAWIFDTWQFHNVINEGSHDRVHLVIDTAGTSAFWDLLERSWKTGDPAADRDSAALVPFDPAVRPRLRFERFNAAAIDPPSVMDYKLSEFRNELGRFAAERPDAFAAVDRVLTGLGQDWRCVWSEHGESAEAVGPLRELVQRTLGRCGSLLEGVSLDSNGGGAAGLLQNWLASAIQPALLEARAKQLASAPRPIPAPRPATAPAAIGETTLASGQPRPNAAAAAGSTGQAGQAVMPFQRPIFIVAAPRSGSTMLFEALCKNAAIWSTGEESHQAIESIPQLAIAAHGLESNALSAADATPDVVRQLRLAFLNRFRDAAGGTRPQPLRFLEKTPKNALRIPFLRQAFPDAVFIHLVREPRPNLGSIIDAWQSGRFVTYPNLPGWGGPPWSLLLPAGWRGLAGKPLGEIAAFQWAAAHRAILDDLADLPASRRCVVRYEDLLADRTGEMRRLCEFAGIPFGPRMRALCEGDLPLSRFTLSRPDPEKWRRHEAEIEAALPGLAAIVARLDAATASGRVGV
jgi:hypothetical protein